MGGNTTPYEIRTTPAPILTPGLPAYAPDAKYPRKPSPRGEPGEPNYGGTKCPSELNRDPNRR